MKHWLLSVIITVAGGATGVFAFLKAKKAGIFKAVALGSDILNIIREGMEASDDDKITTDELERITALIQKLKQDLKGGTK